MSGATHNGYLAWAQVFGVFGLLFFFVLYYGHVRRAWKLESRHPDSHIRNFAMFALLMFVARAINLLAGGGPKDLTFILYLGLIQSVWLMVLNHYRAMKRAKLRIQSSPEKKLAFAAALEGE